MNKIVQNSSGSIFCVPYLKDGVFHLKIFSATHELSDYCINDAIGLDNQTRPNDNFPHPMMDACFIENNDIFINVFHSRQLKMYNMVYNFSKKRIIERPVMVEFAERPGI